MKTAGRLKKLIALLAIGGLAYAMGLFPAGAQPAETTGPILGRPIASEPTQPNFPPGGIDAFETIAEIGLQLSCTGPVETLSVVGDTVVSRTDPQPQPDNSHVIQTEIVSMSLTGVSPTLGTVVVSQSETNPSQGGIAGQPDFRDFPADSFFDVFVDISLPDLGKTVTNIQAVRMQTQVRDIPPIEYSYRSVGDPVKLIDKTTLTDVGCLVHVQHVPSVPSRVKIKRELIRIENQLTRRGVVVCLLAEGATHSGIVTFLTILNPNPADANVQITYFFPTGPRLVKSYVIPAQSRQTLVVNDEVGKATDVSMEVVSDRPIVVERPVYGPGGAHIGTGVCR